MTLSGPLEGAIADHKAGRLADAEAGYRRVLASNPNQFDALHLLGVLHSQQGRHREGIELIKCAAAQEPMAYPAFHNLGLAHLALDELDAARACFDRAIQINPDHVDSYQNLAVIFRRQGNAIDELRALRRVVELRPAWAGAHNNLGSAWHQVGQTDAACKSFAKALELDPALASAAYNMGELLRALGRHAEAAPYLRRAIDLEPEFAWAHRSLGIVLHTQGWQAEALQCMRTARSLDPDYVEARWAYAMAQLPPVHGPCESPGDTRAAFARELGALDLWFTGARVQGGFKAVGSLQPFYLAYHDQDQVELLSKYGDLSARLMRQWLLDQRIRVAERSSEAPIKLAIVSAQIFDQSVWTAIIRGFCEHLDRDRFSVHIFCMSNIDDAETARARSLATSFVQGRTSLREWVDALQGVRPDAILYPEIGMDQMTTRLASLRLAPLQAAAWGHPITTGLPTIDCFLSAAAFEPSEAQEHYREQLVVLPNLGCCYRPFAVASGTQAVPPWGSAADTPVLLCAGTPYKYAPQHDHVYVEIARRLGRARLVFFTDIQPHLSQLLQLRLAREFERGGLDPRQFLLLVPRQERISFFGAMQRADVYLDTIGFSGFNTAMQAVECGLPVVAHKGRFMRARLAAGILGQMGLTELVAHTEAQYVDLAVKLCTDRQYRAAVRERIGRTRQALFDDVAPVRALERVLFELTRSAGSGPKAR